MPLNHLSKYQYSLSPRTKKKSHVTCGRYAPPPSPRLERCRASKKNTTDDEGTIESLFPSMTPASLVALEVLSGVVPALLLFAFTGYKCRQRLRRRRHAYERVNHELDAEEREFKKALEGRSPRDPAEEVAYRGKKKKRGGYERVDVDSDGDDDKSKRDDDDDFSEAQTAQLEMIEKYRSDLLKEDLKSEDDGDLV